MGHVGAVILMFLVMICAFMVLIAQFIIETNENLNIKNNSSTEHVCSTKHLSILPLSRNSPLSGTSMQQICGTTGARCWHQDCQQES